MRKKSRNLAASTEEIGRLLPTATGRAAAAEEIGERDKHSNSAQRSAEEDERLESQLTNDDQIEFHRRKRRSGERTNHRAGASRYDVRIGEGRGVMEKWT